jgi:protein translocase SecG subunit
MNFLKVLLYGLHFLVSLLLIILVVSQTSRHEGLGIAGGSSSAPTQRGRAGIEEQLQVYTKVVAVIFMALSALLYFMVMKFHWV